MNFFLLLSTYDFLVFENGKETNLYSNLAHVVSARATRTINFGKKTGLTSVMSGNG